MSPISQPNPGVVVGVPVGVPVGFAESVDGRVVAVAVGEAIVVGVGVAVEVGVTVGTGVGVGLGVADGVDGMTTVAESWTQSQQSTSSSVPTGTAERLMGVSNVPLRLTVTVRRHDHSPSLAAIRIVKFDPGASVEWPRNRSSARASSVSRLSSWVSKRVSR